MRRREFITLLGGAAAAWPLAAHAQQDQLVRRIGVLMPTADDSEMRLRLTTFQQALQGLGWADGRNVHIEVRFAAGNAADLRKYAAELAALAPDVILAVGSPGLPPLLQATQTVPIVFVVVPDPVGSGFVESLSRPGGNALLGRADEVIE
jgi:putative ABC transport system substrate-binding protein